MIWRLLAAVLLAAYGFRSVELHDTRELAARYAAALAECANGRSFIVGNRIVTCVVADAQ